MEILPVCNKIVIAIESNGFTKILMHNLNCIYIVTVHTHHVYHVMISTNDIREGVFAFVGTLAPYFGALCTAM